MRTATTIAITHEGKTKLVASPDYWGAKDGTPLHEQYQRFRAHRGQPFHPEYAALVYQESDGRIQVLKFRMPENQVAIPVAVAQAAIESREAAQRRGPGPARKSK